jgi:putative transposase
MKQRRSVHGTNTETVFTQEEVDSYRKYRIRQKAIAEISEYNEVFYNRQRRHASVENISPAAY